MFSTYFGGTGDDDGNGVAVDSIGKRHSGRDDLIDGFSNDESARCAVRATPASRGCMDIFVGRLTPVGSGVAYSTYLGGTATTTPAPSASMRWATFTSPGKPILTDFPTTFGAYSTDPLAGGFVTKLTTVGQIAYSTYFGTFFGPADPKGIAVDAAGNAYLTGSCFCRRQYRRRCVHRQVAVERVEHRVHAVHPRREGRNGQCDCHRFVRQHLRYRRNVID